MTLINVCSASGRASPTFLVSWIMRSPSPRKKNLVNKKLLFQYLISWRMKKKISMALSNIKLFLEMIVIFLKKKIEMLGLRPSKNWEKKSLNIIKFLWGHSIFMFFFSLYVCNRHYKAYLPAKFTLPTYLILTHIS